jgi:hypothetical protein
MPDGDALRLFHHSDDTTPVEFLNLLTSATSTKALRDILVPLPIVPEEDYKFSAADPSRGWRAGHLHWYPVGGDRGNAGRIKLAGAPENPIAERTINAMEALIELERQRELMADSEALPPPTPREAAMRYFSLPPLDVLPKWPHPIRGDKAFDYARNLARRVRVRLVRTIRPVEYSVIVEDDGIGQSPDHVHASLLSLGQSDKPDKRYLIGVFGQGGSSAYAASEISWMVSRRSPDLTRSEEGFGWTVVKRILPAGRRDVYWAYLAAAPDGRVPEIPAIGLSEPHGFTRGTRIAHLNYNFGKIEPARTLFQSLNHLLFNPVLPYELYTGPERAPDPMWGNGYRLSRLSLERKALDKTFPNQVVERKGGGD